MTSIEFKVIFYDWYTYNKLIFVVINNFTNFGHIPNILYGFAYIFNIENFVLYYFIAVVYSIYRISKVKNKNEYFSQRFDILFKFGMSYAFIGFLYAFLKYNVNFERPYCSIYTPDFSTIIDYSKRRCLSSFPSGHTAIGVLVLYYFWNVRGVVLNAMLILSLFLLMLSRITLALHYPSDIVYSLLISFLTIKFSVYVYHIFEENIIKSIKKSVYKMIFDKNFI